MCWTSHRTGVLIVDLEVRDSLVVGLIVLVFVARWRRESRESIIMETEYVPVRILQVVGSIAPFVFGEEPLSQGLQRRCGLLVTVADRDQRATMLEGPCGKLVVDLAAFTLHLNEKTERCVPPCMVMCKVRRHAERVGYIAW